MMVTLSRILLIFLLYNGAAYGTTEHERLDMNQRARAALEEILSAEEFKNQGSRPSWWARLVERLFDYLPGEARWLGAVLEWLFYLFLIIAAILAFVFIARRFRRLPSFKTEYDFPTEPQLRMDPGIARMRAYKYSQEGDYRNAIRYLYLSLLLHMDKSGLLTYDVSKTNGEYLGEVYSSIGGKVESFASVTLFFERKWYGMEESSAGDFHRYEEELLDAQNSIIQHPVSSI